MMSIDHAKSPAPAGFLGWYRAGAGKSDALPDVLAAWRTSTRLAGSVQSRPPMSATCEIIGTNVFVESSITASIHGEPRWTHPELQNLSAIKGHAHALAKAYRDKGERVFDFLQGSYCLAVVDSEKSTVLLAVDKMGIQPLYYAQAADGTLYFGTHIDELRTHPHIGSVLSGQQIFQYLFFHVVPAPRTIYENIHKLQRAKCLTFRDGKQTIRSYWEPSFSKSPQLSFDEARHELHTTLESAVRDCGPDVTTGAFLSGGLDSSTVLGVLSKVAQRRVSAYTMGFAVDGYDEIEYARISAQHFGAEGKEYYVTAADVVSALPEIATSYEEPFGNSSALPSLLCARFAHSCGARTLFAGDGGDELFAGNVRYARQKIFEHYQKIPRALRAGVLEPFLNIPILKNVFPISKAASYVAQARIPMPDRLETYNFIYRQTAEAVLAPDFMRSIDTQQPLQLLRDIYRSAPTDDIVDRMLYLDWQITLADNDLPKVSRMCERAGIRVAYPMLDDRLVELSTRIAPEWKLKGTQLRHFYKEAMRGFLPDAVLTKKKHGFGLPFGDWLKVSKELQTLIYDSLTQLRKRQIVRPEFIDELLAAHRSGHASFYGTMVWVLAVLELWLQSREHDAPLSINQ